MVPLCSGGWTISGTPLDLSAPRILAIAEAERTFLGAEYDEYASSNASGAAFCRSAALIVSHKILNPFTGTYMLNSMNRHTVACVQACTDSCTHICIRRSLLTHVVMLIAH